MSRRPDITPVAQSLLGDVRRSSKRSSIGKDLGKAFLLELGMGFANRAINKKAEDFQRNEQVMAEVMRQRNLLIKQVRR